MGYNTENGATFQELPETSPILGKKKRNLLLEIEKKDSMLFLTQHESDLNLLSSFN